MLPDLDTNVTQPPRPSAFIPRSKTFRSKNMKKLIVTLVASCLVQFSAAASDFVPLRDAIENVAVDFLKQSRPERSFTLARPSGVGDEWSAMRPELQAKILRSIGKASQRFVPLDKATRGRHGSLIGPNEELLDIFHVNSIQYVSGDTVEIGFSSYLKPSEGRGAIYKVVFDGKAYKLEVVGRFDSAK